MTDRTTTRREIFEIRDRGSAEGNFDAAAVLVRLDEAEGRLGKLGEAAGHIVFSAEREDASDQYPRASHVHHGPRRRAEGER